MGKQSFTAWRAEIDAYAIRRALVEPGASFTKRHDPDYWRGEFNGGAMPSEAWEAYMEIEG